MKNDLYYVALLLDEVSESAIHDFKLYAREKYGCQAALKSPPHITLVPPFHYSSQKSFEVEEAFESWGIQDSLKIEMRGFSNFGNRTLYVIVKPSDELSELQKCISEKFVNFTKKNLYHFTPHITIANRDIESHALEALLQHFNTLSFERIASIRSAVLFKHNGKFWDVFKERPLTTK